ncbi:MAG: hypothetical protein J5985_07680 [Kiritimatiellae bacterium]|nr:hypothetical protein [Kiritimatiellia bacterium]
MKRVKTGLHFSFYPLRLCASAFKFAKAGRKGFSLVEVNMAVFVMAVGILSMVALYPLGLRESIQGKEDLMEAVFADNLLNQAVAIASSRTLKWSDWDDKNDNPYVPYPNNNSAMRKRLEFTAEDSFNDLPSFMRSKMRKPDLVSDSSDAGGIRHFRIACMRPQAHSGRVMGIMVQSTTENVGDRNDYSNHPIYYAEAYFQGDFEK